LAAKISQLLGGHFSHVFFNNSGSEAVDTVIRLARYYWQLKGQPERNVFIARHNAYHGSTIAGASLGGMRHMHVQGGPWLPGIEHVMQPYQFNEGFGEDPAAFCQRAVDAIEQKILEVGPDKVAAVIGEPIQGAGGVIIPPEGYWPKVEALCRKYGCLLVCDEVICGYGRLGQWFGFQHFGVKPDLVSTAKGLSSGYLPIAAVVVSDAVYQAIADEAHGNGVFGHGFTYSGHPVASAVAAEALRIYHEIDVVGRARTLGPQLLTGLRDALGDHPMVGEVRGIGLLAGIELAADRQTKQTFPAEAKIGAQVERACRQRGIILRNMGDVLALCPPYIIEPDQIDELVRALALAIDDTRKTLSL